MRSGPLSIAEAPGRQLGLLWGFVSVSILAFLPLAPRLRGAVPGCLFKAVTGIPCPGCGSTRAVTALAQLDAFGAFVWNPLFTAGLVALVGGGLVALVWVLSGREVREPRLAAGPLRVALVLLVGVNWAYVIAAGR